MVIEGLDASGIPRGKMMAKAISQSWIRSNYEAYHQVGKMLEKYDATSCGKIGGGGEYNLQVHLLNPKTFDLLPLEKNVEVAPATLPSLVLVLVIKEEAVSEKKLCSYVEWLACVMADRLWVE